MCIVRERRPAGFLDMKCQTCLIRVCRWVIIAGGLPDSPAWLLYITSVPSVWRHCGLVESRKR